MQIEQPKTIKDCVELQGLFVGMTKITKKNFKDFYRRGKFVQILGSGFITNQVDDKMPENYGRTLTLKEVEEHIGYEIQNPSATMLDSKKWKAQCFSIIDESINNLATMEEEGLVPYTEAKETINEENDKATEELEKLATDEPKKYPH
tara:strand:- start:114 stop:557 length:444 start_codon:yes stop_codon:yes gene_type:complete